MFKSEFLIKGMDCPSEERMIRMKLEDAEGLVKLDFDIPNRRLSVFHNSKNVELITKLLNELNMGSSLLVSEKSAEPAIQAVNLRERKVLWWVLAINFALLGNMACLFILQKVKSEGAHIKASWIFTSNDVLVNIGVIVAAVLIIFTNSNLPDLIVGTLVFGLVLRGAFRILKLSK